MADDYLQLLSEATSKLSIEDVQLVKSSSYCDIEKLYELREFSEDFVLENKDQVTQSQEMDDEQNPENNRVVFYAEFGVRWLPSDEKSASTKESKEMVDESQQVDPCCFIEAEYVASYYKKTTLTREQLIAFASRNVVFNIWPYWREYVASQTQRMGVPKLVIPFYMPKMRDLTVSEEES